MTDEFHWDSTKASSMPPTSGTTYNLTTSNAVTTHYAYDGYGNPTDITDPNSHITHYEYDSNGVINKQVLANDSAQLKRTTTYVNDSATALHTSMTDTDNGITTSYTYDALGRPASVSTAGLAETQTTYEDSNLRVITRRDLNTFGDGHVVSVTDYDQLGRVRLTRQLASASTQTDWDNDTEGIKTQTQYRYGTGVSYKLVSNPSRTTSDARMGLLLTTSDPDGRVTATQYFTGAAQPTPWGSNNVTTGSTTATYSANSNSAVGKIGAVTTFTDEASKSRQSTVDGVGRLTQVVEDPSGLNYTTTYSSDVLDNLTAVNQSGQTRTFTYDSLKRLGLATNPESGNTQYTYDSNGNLMTKTDGRNVQTAYGTYDALNRPPSKSFSDGTPAVNYCYDGNVLSGSQCVASSVPYSKGRLTWIGNSASSTSYTAYDALGRVTGSTQTTGSTSYPFLYAYNSGSLTSETYPSGRMIAFTLDGAGRVSAVSGKLGTAPPTPYAGSSSSPITYWPQGAIHSMPLGNGLTESTTFNSRLQPTGIQAGGLSLQYTYSATANNGNPVSQTILWQGTSNQDNYLYDGINRLAQAAESSSVPTQTGCTNSSANWCETYGYDAFGNRTITARTNLTQSTVEATNYDTSTNHNLPTAEWSYDSAGNILSDPLSGSYAYDAENRQKSATVTGSGTTQYSYDGEGRRVVSNGLNGQTVFVYDAQGDLVAEYGIIGPPSTGTKYLTADHLGSTRMVTDSQGNCMERHDYLAYGAEVNRGSGSCYDFNAGVRQRFTGKERDAETGLDYFGARYMSSAQGRFTSPDPLYITKQKKLYPQQWNLYSYAANNPLSLIDPDGREVK